MREQGIDGWRELERRSQDDIGWFWDAVVRHLGIEFSTPYDAVYSTTRAARCGRPGSAAAGST